MSTTLDFSYTYDIAAGEVVRGRLDLTYSIEARQKVSGQLDLTYSIAGAAIVRSRLDLTYPIVGAPVVRGRLDLTYPIVGAKTVRGRLNLTYGIAGAATVRGRLDLTYDIAGARVVRGRLDLTYAILAQAAVRGRLDLTYAILGAIEPSTYTVNIETGAVARYDNAAFMGFANCGGKLYGIKADGLYLLDDDAVTDDGVPILGEITTGRLDFGTKELKQQFSAYVRGESETDDWEVSCAMDGEREWVYPLRRYNQALGTYKALLGRGLRGQYAVYKLRGTRFTLDDFEPVPHVINRRI